MKSVSDIINLNVYSNVYYLAKNSIAQEEHHNFTFCVELSMCHALTNGIYNATIKLIR